MSPTAADLERLHRRLLEGFNPFEDRVVQTPWDPVRYPDVRSIHGTVSDEILALVRRTRDDHSPHFALLRGLPGTGKTHLLRRLRLELGNLGMFVIVGPFGDGRRLHRHILRQICESLDRRRSEPDPRSQLQEFALRILGRAALDHPLDDWVRQRLERDRAYLIEILQQHTDPVRLRECVSERHPGVDRDLVAVLFSLLDPDRTASAARWLQGVELPEEGLATLGLRDSAAEEDRAHEVLRSLIQLSRDSLPLVLCFDQLEFLPTVDGEPGFVALTKVAAQLAMSGPAVLILSCLVETWEEYRQQLPGSALDRLVQNSFVLERPSASQIAEVLATRLQMVRGPLRAPSPTYPFSAAVAVEFATEPGISVRRVLERADRTLEELRRRKRISEVRSLRPAPPVIPFEDWLDAEVEHRQAALREGGALPLDEGLVKRAFVLALDLARRRTVSLGPLQVGGVEDGPKRSHYLHLVAELAQGPEPRRVGLCFCNTENGRSFAAHPENLLREVRNASHRLDVGVLIRDERLLPLPPGWKKGRENFQALQASGGALVPLGRDSLAALETLRTLLAEAAAGDLSGPDRSASQDDVEAAIVRKGLLAHASLWGQLAAALTPQPRGPAPALPEALVETLRGHRLLPWSRLRVSLPPTLTGSELAEVIAAARSAHHRILVLEPEGQDPVFALKP